MISPFHKETRLGLIPPQARHRPLSPCPTLLHAPSFFAKCEDAKTAFQQYGTERRGACSSRCGVSRPGSSRLLPTRRAWPSLSAWTEASSRSANFAKECPSSRPTLRKQLAENAHIGPRITQDSER